MTGDGAAVVVHEPKTRVDLAKALDSPMVLHQRPRKSLTLSASQQVPTAAKVYADIAPRATPIMAAGPLPTPPAMPAESVRRPAPATLFTRLKMDVAGEEPLCLPPPRETNKEAADEMEEEEEEEEEVVEVEVDGARGIPRVLPPLSARRGRR